MQKFTKSFDWFLEASKNSPVIDLIFGELIKFPKSFGLHQVHKPIHVDLSKLVKCSFEK